jgi:outer membrane lipoprotein-sorting protein
MAGPDFRLLWRPLLAGAVLVAAAAGASPASASFLDDVFGPPIGQQKQQAQRPAPAPTQPRAPAPERPPAASRAAPMPAPISTPTTHTVPLPAPRPVAARAAAAPSPHEAARLPLPTKPAAATPAAPKPAAAHKAVAAAAPLSLRSPPPAPAIASPRPHAVARDGFTAAQVDAIERVDAWFNGIQHLVGDFSQIAPNGTRSRGRFFLSKPGKVRFDYAPPSPLEVVCDGTSVAVLDRSLQNQQLYPLSETPLRYLLKPNLDLLRDAHVVAVDATPQRIAITVQEKSKLVGTSRLEVVFDAAPLSLSRWTITDPQGLTTTVSVSNLDTRSVPPDHLFAINYMHDVPSIYR